MHRHRVDKRTGVVLTDETLYALASFRPEPAAGAALLGLLGRHWTFENTVHRVRDVVLSEDATTTHTDHAARLSPHSPASP